MLLFAGEGKRERLVAGLRERWRRFPWNRRPKVKFDSRHDGMLFGTVPFLRPVPPRPKRRPYPQDTIWLKEKPELLKTHLGWFVAYQDGKRIVLEPAVISRGASTRYMHIMQRRDTRLSQWAIDAGRD